MLQFYRTATISLLCTIAAGQFSGVATFNNYTAQGHTVCGPLSGSNGAFGTAVGDISPNISQGTTCVGDYQNPDYSQCAAVNSGSYVGPSCTQNACGTCYQVTNNGGYGGASVEGVGSSITVQVIDVCPAESADNYCKAESSPPVPADERCGDSSTNSMDIDFNAYASLTGGTAWSPGVPNLMIGITGPVSC